MKKWATSYCNRQVATSLNDEQYKLLEKETEKRKISIYKYVRDLILENLERSKNHESSN